MKYLHTMVRVSDLDESLHFYCDLLGLHEVRRRDSESGRYTLVCLSSPEDDGPLLELTYNWDEKDYAGGRSFGHLAYAVDDIYEACRRFAIDGVTIELLQRGEALPAAEPWASMPNTGSW